MRVKNAKKYILLKNKQQNRFSYISCCYPLQRTFYTKRINFVQKNDAPNFNYEYGFLILCLISHCIKNACSIIQGLWSQDVHTMQWQVTTQPNFVTKLKPTQWEELPSQIKPKPTKKPISLVSDLVKQSTLPPIHSTSKPSSYPPKPTGVFFHNVFEFHFFLVLIF